MKSLYLASSFVLIVGFNACSDNSQEKSQKQNAEEAATATPKIEIVQNSDAHAIKVEQKSKDKTKGSSYYYDYGQKSEYDQNAQPANKDASVRVRPRTKIDANMNVRSPYEEVQVSMLVKKLSKNFIIRCSPCHNDYANGIIGPSLLGRDADFIYEKIQEFKTGKKSNPLMNDLINMMSDREIRSMADEIYNFNKEIKQMRNK
jgi:cytochrome c553